MPSVAYCRHNRQSYPYNAFANIPKPEYCHPRNYTFSAPRIFRPYSKILHKKTFFQTQTKILTNNFRSGAVRFVTFCNGNFALHYLHTLPMYLRRYCLNFEMYYIHWVLMQLTPYLFVSFPSNNKFIAIRFTTSTLTAFPKALNALAIVSGYSANSSIH